MSNARNLTEQELLTQLSVKAPSALEELIGMYFPVLCIFAERILTDPSLAKDMVQETFIKFWHLDRSFESFDALKGFLYATTRNGCLNLLRGMERRENRHLEAQSRIPDMADPIDSELVHAETIALIYRVVRTLPRPAQEIFYLSYEEGMTVSEIAAQLNMKLKTVKNHKYKTLLLLRAKLRSDQGPLLVFLSLLMK